MAQTSTAVNACDVKIYLEDGSAVERDISGVANTVTMNWEHALGEMNTFDGLWPVRMGCKLDASFDLTILYSLSAIEGLNILRGWYFYHPNDARHLRVLVPGAIPGAHVYEADCLLESFNFDLDASEAGPVAVSATLKPGVSSSGGTPTVEVSNFVS